MLHHSMRRQRQIVIRDRDVMARAKIPTHDLYAYAFERLDRIQKPADVHFTPEGSVILADDVVRAILETLHP